MTSETEPARSLQDVVVADPSASTTTSKKLKPPLTPQTVYALRVQLRLSKLPQPTVLGVDVTGNSVTTTLTQLQPHNARATW